MTRRFYPAILERGPKRSFGVWFPDFPDCVAAGTSQEVALERAQNMLAVAVVSLAEQDEKLPEPTPMERVVIPKGCDFIAFIIVSVEPPDVSERVNVYLPKLLIAKAERLAAELGMNRSSFFGFALSRTIAGMSLGSNLEPWLRKAKAKRLTKS